jgi:hypothetical protein
MTKENILRFKEIEVSADNISSCRASIRTTGFNCRAKIDQRVSLRYRVGAQITITTTIIIIIAIIINFLVPVHSHQTIYNVAYRNNWCCTMCTQPIQNNRNKPTFKNACIPLNLLTQKTSNQEGLTISIIISVSSSIKIKVQTRRTMKYCIPAPTILNQHNEEFSRCRTFCQIGADPDMEKTLL